MLAGTVYENVIATLQNAPTLNYIGRGRVFKGFRHDIEKGSMPAIAVEPVRNNEIDKNMNQIKDIFVTLDVFIYVSNEFTPEKMIIGDNVQRGSFTIENDIRAVLTSSNTLGDTVIDIQIEPSNFDFQTLYPTRLVQIPIRVLYRQDNNK